MRDEAFTIEAGCLRRFVMPQRGDPYVHACTRDVFVEVLHTIDERHMLPFVYEEIAHACGHPFSQVATAIAFLKERSIIVPTWPRKHVAAGECVYLDGMVEWWALTEDKTT